jgi:poly-gamma-glutamate synthesis protein (capsule biosynthesis protein)
MNTKKTVFAIIVSAGLIILSTVFFIMVKNTHIPSISEGDARIIKATETDKISYDNEESYKEIIEEDILEHNTNLVDTSDKVSLIPTDIPEPDLGPFDEADEEEIIPEDTYDTITISAAGDVTLGRDESFGWDWTFDHEFERQKGDYGYFFRNVKDIFEADDLTIVNLETTLTTATKKAEKKFRFKADPSYVEILKQGSIEAVSIANNHTLDYLDKGYKDTLAALDEAGVGYFGYEHRYITQVRDIKIGVLGFYSMKVTDELKDEIKQAIEELRNEGTDLVIVMFHWGIERAYKPNSVQKELAYHSIDCGADLVLGSHPHVLQDIEEYKGKQIVYSLANFCFGGNKNPNDKDTMIYIHKFNFKNGELISQEYDIIPCSVSSVSSRNNYQPTPLEGAEADRVLKKIKKNSDF